jgi:hypothetical protein
MIGPQLRDPICRFWSRRCGYDDQTGSLGQLDRDGPHASACANDQDAFGSVAAVPINGKAVEEGLIGRTRRYR